MANEKSSVPCACGARLQPTLSHDIVQQHKCASISAIFLIKQLVVNSKKIGGSAAGQTKRTEKNRSLLVFFEYSINHNNRTSV